MKNTIYVWIILFLVAMMVFCLNAIYMNGSVAYGREMTKIAYGQEATKINHIISATTTTNASSNMSIPWFSRATTLQPIEEPISCCTCHKISPGTLQTPIETTFNDAADLYNDGYEKFQTGEYVMAASKYADAIEITNKALAAMWYNKGCALYYYGQKDQALLSFEKALEINPNYQNATLNRDQILQELGRDGA